MNPPTQPEYYTPSLQSAEVLHLSSAKNADLVRQKHQQIIDGACKKFFKKGYHRTTIREIAEASGMSMGQLYHYISSKDDVLFLIYDHMQRVWREHLIISGIEQASDPVERLDQALYFTLEFMMANKDLLFFIYTETKYLDKKYLKTVLEMDNHTVVGYWRDLLIKAKIKMPNENQLAFFANLLSYLMVFIPLRGWNFKENIGKKHLKWLVCFIRKGLGISSTT